MGNPTLWSAQKLGVLCSRNAPRPPDIPEAEVYFSGFHSPMEREILDRLLAERRPVIWCPAWGIGADTRPALTPAPTPATADSHSRATISLTTGCAKIFPASRWAQIVTKYIPPPA